MEKIVEKARVKTGIAGTQISSQKQDVDFHTNETTLKEAEEVEGID